ncbi:hypothetical protein ABB37_06122 [Leptomonas pyrrhocoris]|uniref:Uncharacterized protein n=1 Tax=Leptomonas pyrrhocoris TaxID=157538 RepID=A0A0N0DU70_LEPPY|nr:hypothetical protein ABB37_06122 [Leptomonas pyrrhocoris]KPA78511.1 hypothetical protein ABB37_06122 [Leptomonas pyrrhocoris]|eukprot:XP_015656950.1 hypothetical protein ABB37_06122 [Leptomonas pyrrhocoris]
MHREGRDQSAAGSTRSSPVLSAEAHGIRLNACGGSLPGITPTYHLESVEASNTAVPAVSEETAARTNTSLNRPSDAFLYPNNFAGAMTSTAAEAAASAAEALRRRHQQDNTCCTPAPMALENNASPLLRSPRCYAPLAAAKEGENDRLSRTLSAAEPLLPPSIVAVTVPARPRFVHTPPPKWLAQTLPASTSRPHAEQKTVKPHSFTAGKPLAATTGMMGREGSLTAGRDPFLLEGAPALREQQQRWATPTANPHHLQHLQPVSLASAFEDEEGEEEEEEVTEACQLPRVLSTLSTTSTADSVTPMVSAPATPHRLREPGHRSMSREQRPLRTHPTEDESIVLVEPHDSVDGPCRTRRRVDRHRKADQSMRASEDDGPLGIGQGSADSLSGSSTGSSNSSMSSSSAVMEEFLLHLVSATHNPAATPSEQNQPQPQQPRAQPSSTLSVVRRAPAPAGETRLFLQEEKGELEHSAIPHPAPVVATSPGAASAVATGDERSGPPPSAASSIACTRRTTMTENREEGLRTDSVALTSCKTNSPMKVTEATPERIVKMSAADRGGSEGALQEEKPSTREATVTGTNSSTASRSRENVNGATTSLPSQQSESDTAADSGDQQLSTDMTSSTELGVDSLFYKIMEAKQRERRRKEKFTSRMSFLANQTASAAAAIAAAAAATRALPQRSLTTTTATLPRAPAVNLFHAGAPCTAGAAPSSSSLFSLSLSSPRPRPNASTTALAVAAPQRASPPPAEPFGVLSIQCPTPTSWEASPASLRSSPFLLCTGQAPVGRSAVEAPLSPCEAAAEKWLVSPRVVQNVSFSRSTGFGTSGRGLFQQTALPGSSVRRGADCNDVNALWLTSHAASATAAAAAPVAQDKQEKFSALRLFPSPLDPPLQRVSGVDNNEALFQAMRAERAKGTKPPPPSTVTPPFCDFLSSSPDSPDSSRSILESTSQSDTFCQLRTRSHAHAEQHQDRATGAQWVSTMIEVEELPSGVQRIAPMLDGVTAAMTYAGKDKASTSHTSALAEEKEHLHGLAPVWSLSVSADPSRRAVATSHSPLDAEEDCPHDSAAVSRSSSRETMGGVVPIDVSPLLAPLLSPPLLSIPPVTCPANAGLAPFEGARGATIGKNDADGGMCGRNAAATASRASPADAAVSPRRWFDPAAKALGGDSPLGLDDTAGDGGEEGEEEEGDDTTERQGGLACATTAAASFLADRAPPTRNVGVLKLGKARFAPTSSFPAPYTPEVAAAAAASPSLIDAFRGRVIDARASAPVRAVSTSAAIATPPPFASAAFSLPPAVVAPAVSRTTTNTTNAAAAAVAPLSATSALLSSAAARKVDVRSASPAISSSSSFSSSSSSTSPTASYGANPLEVYLDEAPFDVAALANSSRSKTPLATTANPATPMITGGAPTRATVDITEARSFDESGNGGGARYHCRTAVVRTTPTASGSDPLGDDDGVWVGSAVRNTPHKIVSADYAPAPHDEDEDEDEDDVATKSVGLGRTLTVRRSTDDVAQSSSHLNRMGNGSCGVSGDLVEGHRDITEALLGDGRLADVGVDLLVASKSKAPFAAGHEGQWRVHDSSFSTASAALSQLPGVASVSAALGSRGDARQATTVMLTERASPARDVARTSKAVAFAKTSTAVVVAQPSTSSSLHIAPALAPEGKDAQQCTTLNRTAALPPADGSGRGRNSTKQFALDPSLHLVPAAPSSRVVGAPTENPACHVTPPAERPRFGGPLTGTGSVRSRARFSNASRAPRDGAATAKGWPLPLPAPPPPAAPQRCSPRLTCKPPLHEVRSADDTDDRHSM